MNLHVGIKKKCTFSLTYCFSSLALSPDSWPLTPALTLYPCPVTAQTRNRILCSVHPLVGTASQLQAYTEPVVSCAFQAVRHIRDPPGLIGSRMRSSWQSSSETCEFPQPRIRRPYLVLHSKRFFQKFLHGNWCCFYLTGGIIFFSPFNCWYYFFFFPELWV